MPSSTIEDYLKAIYQLRRRDAGEHDVALVDLAERVSVTPGTVTTMVKRMAEAGLVSYETRGRAGLTENGERIALQVLRRHRLVEQFLVDVLHYDWSDVHEEAEILEHAISDRLIEKIDQVLGHPDVDPHGDPIPNASGEIARRASCTLSDCPAGDTRIERISDQNPEFLRFLNEHGLKPGAAITIERHDPAAEVVTVRVGSGEAVQLGTTAAKRILVSTDAS